MAQQNKPPLMMVPLDLAKKLSFPFLGISFRLKKFLPALPQELQAAEIDMDDYEYIAISIVNIFFFYLLFFGLLFVLSYQIQLKPLPKALAEAALYAVGIGLLITFALIRYPSIMAGKRAEQINKNLIFALRDLLMQISSGISLYNGFVNVSKAGYGLVSEEFEKVAKAINTGSPVDEALKMMAIGTKSDYLKRITWQIVSTIKAGSSLKGALRAVVRELTREQKTMIRDYAHELNLWSLIYMLFAVAVPTIGAVMLVILSSFAGMGINNTLFIGFIVLCFLIQYVLIGFIKARRPVVQF
jgi:flagellar protein FlaJ